MWKEQIVGDFQIVSDGRTVWVNADTGECVARFSHFGIDIHRRVNEQIAGKPECLLCTHERPGTAEWITFTEFVETTYKVKIAAKHKPAWLS